MIDGRHRARGWQIVAVAGLVLLAGCLLQRRAGSIARAVRRLTWFAPGTGLVPGAGRTWSEARYPDQYRSDNQAHAVLVPLDDDDDPAARLLQRFIDVGGRAYSGEFISSFSYHGGRGRPAPTVSLVYLKRAETFVALLDAEHLKPNFAYQVKLRAIHGDRVAFERIGYLGRWALPDHGPNVSDRQYAAFPDPAQTESYLLFDFFVTDEHGAARKPLYADSSLHVLFHATRQRRPRPSDSRAVTVVCRDPGGGVYANPDAVFGEESVYAEAESGSASGNRRPAIGRAFLSPGVYRAELVLTEESFHWFGDGGQWATVLGAPLAFEILDQPRPPRP